MPNDRDQPLVVAGLVPPEARRLRRLLGLDTAVSAVWTLHLEKLRRGVIGIAFVPSVVMTTEPWRQDRN